MNKHIEYAECPICGIPHDDGHFINYDKYKSSFKKILGYEMPEFEGKNIYICLYCGDMLQEEFQNDRDIKAHINHLKEEHKQFLKKEKEKIKEADEKELLKKELVSIRHDLKLSQSKFAKEFGINLRTLQSWEAGTRKIDRTVLFLIKKLLDNEKNLC